MDAQGATWTGNTGWNGVSGVVGSTHTIAGTQDQGLYQYWVYGPGSGGNPPATFTYSLPSGAYTLTLYEQENTASTIGQRVFNVLVNGQPMLTGVDILASAGAQWTAVQYTIPVSVTTGQLQIQLVSQTGFTTKLCALSIIPAGPPPPPPPSNGPNIVVVMADDMRTEDLSYLPQMLGAINSESVQFLNYYVSTPLCCPSRATFFSGLYAHNTGVYQNYGSGNAGAPAFNDSSTVATWLKGAGYVTGLYGKYLNGYYQLNGGAYIPPGWTDWHAQVGSPNAQGFLTDGDFYNGYWSNDNGTVAPNPVYGTDWVFNSAISYLSSPQAVGKPVFLYLAPPAPHDPFEAAPQDVGYYANTPANRPPSFNRIESTKPQWLQSIGLLTQADIQLNDANRLKARDTLRAVDRGVVNLISALQATGRWPNTVFIFTSDNGLFWGEHALSNAKDNGYEEGTHQPLIIRVPGQAPGTTGALAENIDLAPSIAAWAGAVPASRVNGVPLQPVIAGNLTGWRQYLLTEELGVLSGQKGTLFGAVRDSQYKLITMPTGEQELYDLRNDPYEMRNLIGTSGYASILSTLQTQLAILKAQ